MIRKYLISILMCTFIPALCAMEESKTKIADFCESTIIGAATGTTEVLVDQPLIGLKNWLQLPKKKRMPLSLKTVYRGLDVNVLGMAPATAFQIGTNNLLEKVVEGDSMPLKLIRAAFAGKISALVASPIELIVLNKQMSGGSTKAVFRKIINEAGVKGLARGMFLASFREGTFTPTYLVVYPFLKQKLEEKIGQKGAVLVSGIITGGTVSYVTQPLDTMKTRLQADYSKEAIKGAKDAAKALYNEIDEKTMKKNGFKGFYKGVTARATRAAIAVPLMAAAYEFYKNSAEKLH